MLPPKYPTIALLAATLVIGALLALRIGESQWWILFRLLIGAVVVAMALRSGPQWQWNETRDQTWLRSRSNRNLIFKIVGVIAMAFVLYWLNR